MNSADSPSEQYFPLPIDHQTHKNFSKALHSPWMGLKSALLWIELRILLSQYNKPNWSPNEATSGVLLSCLNRSVSVGHL
jgi:hypothetical protein